MKLIACQLWHLTVTLYKYAEISEKLCPLLYLYPYFSLILFFCMGSKKLSFYPISIPWAQLLILPELFILFQKVLSK